MFLEFFRFNAKFIFLVVCLELWTSVVCLFRVGKNTYISCEIESKKSFSFFCDTLNWSFAGFWCNGCLSSITQVQNYGVKNRVWGDLG